MRNNRLMFGAVDPEPKKVFERDVADVPSRRGIRIMPDAYFVVSAADDVPGITA